MDNLGPELTEEMGNTAERLGKLRWAAWSLEVIPPTNPRGLGPG